ncbi:hypothetical protein PHSY_003217 [Pseudozyma hubeiensis SY62]|uniref:Alpha-ketoglutarate-dependent dioxygenase AlkB-like domain-containing protein n=1 Tax=Pseudozyma hubeiensis (strain SY62) TaxID=1305764 RepID=R9P2S6_PSEHS|nr:hypothetical protein PHSY_003217 [Pseudozyma hubeiensis SY62]GAC95641.1 hypothetical protein PHSY_003217 [Pseudozyma hubeiensis SY62]
MTGRPIIWSETRQELCESLPYYRAYQTGCYVTSSHHSTKTLSTASHPSSVLLKDSVPYGYLLAGFPSRRDAWSANGRVIISHGGGKSHVVPPDGDDAAAGSASQPKASLRQDQSASDSIIRALLHSARHRLPIVLIAGEGYALLPWKLACGYAVLGWYVITDAWAEREANGGEGDLGYVRWKFRFEWIPAQGEPWWELEAEGGGKGWDPRLRVETLTKAQRRLSKKMRGKTADGRSGALTMSRSDSSSSETGHMDEDEREHLLFGPLDPAPQLVSTVTITPRSSTPCTLTNSARCLVCHSPSPTVFADWMCLQPTCPAFFLLSTGSPPAEHSLTFATSFLRPLGASLDSTFPSGQPPFPLIPERPSSTSMDQSRGLWCKKCGRLSCREVIFQPRCSHCGSTVGNRKPLPFVAAPTLERDSMDVSGETEGDARVFDPVISDGSGVIMSVRRDAGLVMYTFTFPETFGDCKVHLVQSDVDRGGREDEADRIFEEFQRLTWPSSSSSTEAPAKSTERNHSTSSTTSQSGTIHNTSNVEAIPFRRHVLKTHAGGGRMLTQQFTCNYGVAYKHVVAMGTQPLCTLTSPAPILSTLSLLHTRTRSVVPSLEQDFNELYPVLYLEHQKMSFHDDGEPGLGPIVSSLSLGSACRMKFRIKQKFSSHFPRITNRTLLDLPLRHGSVVVQQGKDLQRMLEHCVNPDGFRIAVTARRIDPVENGGPVKRSRTETSGAARNGSIGRSVKRKE